MLEKTLILISKTKLARPNQSLQMLHLLSIIIYRPKYTTWLILIPDSIVMKLRQEFSLVVLGREDQLIVFISLFL